MLTLLYSDLGFNGPWLSYEGQNTCDKRISRSFWIFIAQHYKLGNWQPCSRVLEWVCASWLTVQRTILTLTFEQTSELMPLTQLCDCNNKHLWIWESHLTSNPSSADVQTV